MYLIGRICTKPYAVIATCTARTWSSPRTRSPRWNANWRLWTTRSINWRRKSWLKKRRLSRNIWSIRELRRKRMHWKLNCSGWSNRLRNPRLTLNNKRLRKGSCWRSYQKLMLRDSDRRRNLIRLVLTPCLLPALFLLLRAALAWLPQLENLLAGYFLYGPARCMYWLLSHFLGD